MPIKVVLAVPDKDYALRLSAYLREEEPGWETVVVTQEAALRSVLNEHRESDVLLGRPEWVRAAREFGLRVRKAIALAERVDARDEMPQMLQFQPLPSLLAGLRGHLAEGRADAVQGPQVWTVFSASGGAGKTTAALNLARQAGERGRRTFYLNLERLNATSLLFGKGDADSFSSLLYRLQADPRRWEEEFNRRVRHQPFLRADYLDAPDHPGERLALTAELRAKLIEAVAGTGRYDLVVVDPDSGAGEWHRALLEQSTGVIWLVSDDKTCLAKTEQLWTYWWGNSGAANAQVEFVQNKSLGSPLQRWPIQRERPALMLPYVPEWKSSDQPGRWFDVPAYCGAVDLLLNRLGFGDRPHSAAGRREVRPDGGRRSDVRGAG